MNQSSDDSSARTASRRLARVQLHCETEPSRNFAVAQLDLEQPIRRVRAITITVATAIAEEIFVLPAECVGQAVRACSEAGSGICPDPS